MKARLCLLLLVLTGAAPAAEPTPVGSYRLVGEQDVASGLVLWPDGRFEYFLSAGAMDKYAEGRWSAVGRIVTITTEPKPVPPRFLPSTRRKTDEAVLTVQVTSPEGGGIAGVDLRVGFDRGAPLDAYTQEDGWSLPEGEKRIPRWVELAVPMHDLRSERFPINLAAGNALGFTLDPNDLGVVDFTGAKAEVAGKGLILNLDGARLRYERVR